jgi:hypothetical protein
LPLNTTIPAGGGFAVTVTCCVVDPPAPVQARVNVVVAVSGGLDSVPDGALVPVQPSEAVQDVALVDDHVRVVEKFVVTVVGSALNVTVGGPINVAVALALAEPPVPEQVKVKVVVAFNAALISVPVVAFVPLQAPEAEHEVALVLLQATVTV